MSKRYLVAIANYQDYRQAFFNTYTSNRNKDYAFKHNFEYLEFTKNLPKFRDHPMWLQFSLVRDLISNNTFKENDIVTYVDADACLHNMELPFITNKSFTYSIDSGNTHCMGIYSIKINEWTVKLLNLILDEHRYANLNNKESYHEHFNFMSCFWHEFRGQASWYSLAGIKRHSNVPFYNLAHYGWHSAKDEWTVYSLEELYKNVEILPTCWNVTEMEGESSCEFNINKVEKKDVIIRHFAGGQPWREEWFNI